MRRPEQENENNTAGSSISSRSTEEISSRTQKPKTRYDPVIFRDWCKACGICTAFCPKQVIGLRSDGKPVIERPDDCIGCRFCELHCPDFAISVRERPNNGERHS